MSRRSVCSTRAVDCRPALPTIELRALGAVTGGQIGPRTTLDPVLLQGMEQLAQAIVTVGQSLEAAKQSSTQQLMQLIQQLMQARGGR